MVNLIYYLTRSGIPRLTLTLQEENGMLEMLLFVVVLFWNPFTSSSGGAASLPIARHSALFGHA